MKIFSILLFTILICNINMHAQGVGINNTATAPDASAMLDVSSTTKGFLPPRMTLLQRNFINQPATGIIIYQTVDVTGLYCNKSTTAVPDWQLIGPVAPVAPLTYGYFSSGFASSGIGTNNVFQNYPLTTANSANGISSNFDGSVIVSQTGLYRIDFQAVTSCSFSSSQIDVNVAVNGVNTPQPNSTSGGSGSIQTLSDFRIISLTIGSTVSLRYRTSQVFDKILSGGLIITQLR